MSLCSRDCESDNLSGSQRPSCPCSTAREEIKCTVFSGCGTSRGVEEGAA